MFVAYYSEEVMTEPLVRPSDFTSLASNEGYAKIGEYGIFKSTFTAPEKTEEDYNRKECKAYIPREDLDMADLTMRYQARLAENNAIVKAAKEREAV